MIARPGWSIHRQSAIAFLALGSIAAHLVMRFGVDLDESVADIPLYAALLLGGAPLVWDLLRKGARLEFGSDLLAGISIVTAALIGQYLAGALVVLMLSGGQAIEARALARASSVLRALAHRIPSVAHRKVGGSIETIGTASIQVGDVLVVLPHEVGSSRVDLQACKLEYSIVSPK